MVHVLGNVLKAEVQLLWHKNHDLPDFTSEDCIVLPGGFSYGDYLRAGALANFSPIMQAVRQFAENGGKVLGICNGFQILCESGLLPGVLVRNEKHKFISKNVLLRVETSHSLLTQGCSTGQILKMPIAHAEGRFVADEATLQSLRDNDQILFTYVNEAGINESENGSTLHIAGITNHARNVFGMMPHPERASELILGNNDGLILFESLYGKILQTV